MPGSLIAGAAALTLAASPGPSVERAPRGSTDARDPIVSVRTSKPMVAMTFDDGPVPKVTPLYLSALREHRAKATFFLVGQTVRRAPSLVRKELAAGHEVASHTSSHRNLLQLDPAGQVAEIEAGQAAIQQVTGTRPALFRPPFGAMNTTIGGRVAAAGARSVGWNVNVEGVLRNHTITAAVRVLVRQARRGSIILAHDGPHARPRTLATIRRLLPALRARGLRVVTVSELLENAGR